MLHYVTIIHVEEHCKTSTNSSSQPYTNLDMIVRQASTSHVPTTCIILSFGELNGGGVAWKLSVFVIVAVEHGILVPLRDQTNDHLAGGDALTQVWQRLQWRLSNWELDVTLYFLQTAHGGTRLHVEVPHFGV
jgi:hypothetical protein